MINEDLMDENMDNSEIEIDPNDLIIIYDNHNWKPPKQYILAYAEQLEFDINNDPPEMLSIAEKYLTKDIPEQFRRAFHKKTLQLVYINTITKEVELSSEFEEAAKEEYKEAKEKYLKEKKEKELIANKATVIPRKKIPPIGAKKALEDPKKLKQKENFKEIKKSYKESDKKQIYQDEETRQLQQKLEKEEKNRANILNKDINNNYNEEDIKEKYKYSDDENIKTDSENNLDDFNDEDIDYDKKHEINSRERKFPSKNKIQNNNNYENNINNKNVDIKNNE